MKVASRLPLFLLVGSLSMLTAEVLAGSSNYWFLDIFGLLLTLPLYMLHLLLFLNLAILTKRTRLWDLYLWGCLFALYESWVTKVLWSGYFNAAPVANTFLGLAPVGFLVLVFFWHPIMSFIVPIESFQALSESDGLASHTVFLRKRGMAILLFLYFLGAVARAANSGYDILLAEIPFLATVLIVYVLYRLSTRQGRGFTIIDLVVGRKGLLLLIGCVVALYAVTFPLLLPERAPTDILPYLMIAEAYLVFGLLLYLRGEAPERLAPFPISGGFLDEAVVLAALAMMFLCMMPPISNVILIVLYLGMAVAGPLIFLFCVRDTARLIKARRGLADRGITSGPRS